MWFIYHYTESFTFLFSPSYSFSAFSELLKFTLFYPFGCMSAPLILMHALQIINYVISVESFNYFNDHADFVG